MNHLQNQEQQSENTGRRVVCLQKFHNNFLSGLLEGSNNTQHALPRPVVDAGWREPVLGGFAHVVWDHDHSNPGDEPQRPPRRIFLGSSHSATQPFKVLTKEGIGGIVNSTKVVPCRYRSQGIKYCQVAINDVAAADLITYLPGATKFIRAALEEFQVSVLVHCMAGVSRSSSLVLAYLMEYEEMTLDEAYVHVKQRRPLIDPNDGFWAQLMMYEKRCQRKRSIKATENTLVSPPTVATIDKEWAKQSSALYGACRDMELSNKDFLDGCFGDLKSKPWTVKESLQILNVVLDYIWGRGVLQVEVDWLAAICQVLDEACGVKGKDAYSSVNQVEDILADSDSEFCSQWAGEIYGFQLTRVLETLLGPNKSKEINS